MAYANSHDIAAHLLLRKVRQPLGQNLPIIRAAKRPHVAAQHLANDTRVENLCQLLDGPRPSPLQADEHFGAALLGGLHEARNVARVGRNRPLNVHVLARLDAGQRRLVVPVDARVANDQIHVGVGGEGRRVAVRGGAAAVEAVGCNGRLGGRDGAVAQRDNLEALFARGAGEAGEVGGRSPCRRSVGGEADDGCADWLCGCHGVFWGSFQLTLCAGVTLSCMSDFYYEILALFCCLPFGIRRSGA